MELVYIEPVGLWRGLSSELTAIPNTGNERLLDPCAYGGIPKDSVTGTYYVMTEEAYQKAQRDCFKFFYRSTSMLLPPSENDIMKDRTVVCNLLSMKFDMGLPETGSMVLRDASPYVARLACDAGEERLAEYESGILAYGKRFVAQIEKIRCNGNLFMFETEEEEIRDILWGKVPFALPGLPSIRSYDKYLAVQFFLKGKDYEEICGIIQEYSLLPAWLPSCKGFVGYARNIVAEVIFDCQYPIRIESLWARKVNRLIQGTWLENPLRNDNVRVPCRIVGRIGDDVQVLASDADAELGLPYQRDDIYLVSQTWISIRTNYAGQLEEAGLRFCNWV